MKNITQLTSTSITIDSIDKAPKGINSFLIRSTIHSVAHFPRRTKPHELTAVHTVMTVDAPEGMNINDQREWVTSTALDLVKNVFSTGHAEDFKQIKFLSAFPSPLLNTLYLTKSHTIENFDTLADLFVFIVMTHNLLPSDAAFRFPHNGQYATYSHSNYQADML